jgi:hypothetical protein
MSAYFDKNHDLWIEVSLLQLPDDIKITGTITQSQPMQSTNLPLGNYAYGTYYPPAATPTPITYMNLTKYIHDQTLLKIVKKLDEDV